MAKKKNMDKTPRVNIVYDVYTGGAKEERELPFVVGVLADLSGNPEEPLPRLRDRKFVEIDKNTFDSVLAAVRPRISIDVPNTLEGKSEPSRLRVDPRISRLEDFEPEPLARQIPELRQLLEGRDRLANLLAKAELRPHLRWKHFPDIIRERGEGAKGRPLRTSQSPGGRRPHRKGPNHEHRRKKAGRAGNDHGRRPH